MYQVVALAISHMFCCLSDGFVCLFTDRDSSLDWMDIKNGYKVFSWSSILESAAFPLFLYLLAPQVGQTRHSFEIPLQDLLLHLRDVTPRPVSHRDLSLLRKGVGIFTLYHLCWKMCTSNNKSWCPPKPSLELRLSHWDIRLPGCWVTMADNKLRAALKMLVFH